MSRRPALALLWLTAACHPPGSTSLQPLDDPRPTASTGTDSAANGVAVVELFTSEGCSSCPPADAVLGDLARSGGATYALAFHVDYWDELGWPDRFATPELTARQRWYARAFGASGMYTPQMVVGGTTQFTGSDRARADEAIAATLARPATATLSLVPRLDGGAGVSVAFAVHGGSPDDVLDLALVQKAATTQVRAGENAGRMLTHANVVRAFAAVPLREATGTQVLQLPPDLPPAQAEVLAYVQHPPSSGVAAIVGAARASLP